MRLQFIAARHYASQGHWDNAYAYILRSRLDDVPQHEDTYNRNAQAWHYTNASINELIQGAEQALENRYKQVAQGPQFWLPRDSLIPSGHSTGTPSPARSVQEEEQRPKGSASIVSTREVMKQGRKLAHKSPLSPDKESQREERNSVIDAVKQITGAQRETPRGEGVSTGDTPKYDWDTRYDGIQGFQSHLVNPVHLKEGNYLGEDPEPPRPEP